MKPHYTTETCPPYDNATNGLLTAMRIAIKYTHRTPTWRELVADHGMHRATAFRWLRAFKDAKGQP